MNKNPQKRYREIGEDNRMVAVIRFYILLPSRKNVLLIQTRKNLWENNQREYYITEDYRESARGN